ncbi:Hypothetical protein NGAL_HAMBI2605_28980 [Neorhizobium galegae bv. orientalis]|nr:Hypothetical protein NGAL_HAMBI2566_11990 [Neorhizobium galegae bv. orientalis]CDZ64270.1 Hypothetical protein NGAL_HAMBI2605_28980 [Neorhizobium galegae bv. orientalis]
MPRDEKVRLLSELTGTTTIPYRFEPGQDMTALMGSACNKLRDHIRDRQRIVMTLLDDLSLTKSKKTPFLLTVTNEASLRNYG